jgi:hypothetical protein
MTGSSSLAPISKARISVTAQIFTNLLVFQLLQITATLYKNGKKDLITCFIDHAS